MFASKVAPCDRAYRQIRIKSNINCFNIVAAAIYIAFLNINYMSFDCLRITSEHREAPMLSTLFELKFDGRK